MSPPSFHRLANKNFLIVCRSLSLSLFLFVQSVIFPPVRNVDFLVVPLTQLLTILWRFHP